MSSSMLQHCMNDPDVPVILVVHEEDENTDVGVFSSGFNRDAPFEFITQEDPYALFTNEIAIPLHQQ